MVDYLSASDNVSFAGSVFCILSKGWNWTGLVNICVFLIEFLLCFVFTDYIYTKSSYANCDCYYI